MSTSTAGCASRPLAPDERVVHVREFLAVAPGGDAIVVLEVVDVDGVPPRATLSRWSGGAREVLATDEGPEAAAAAELAGSGGLPSGALNGRLGATIQELSWQNPAPAASGPPWTPPELPGTTLEQRLGVDPRYGPGVRLVLRDISSGAGEEVARFPGREPPAIELRFLQGNRVAATIRPPAVPGAVVADIALLDLGPAAARLLAAEAERLAAAGDRGAARERLGRARALAPGEPSIAYREASLAAAGGDREGTLAALTRAIALDPSYYRMRARTDPAFAALRGDPAFDALVRPRALP